MTITSLLVRVLFCYTFYMDFADMSAPPPGSATDLINLVNKEGRRIGAVEKLAAHQDEGYLHEAFSIFIFNTDGELLIHQRAGDKYHSPDLWTNTCCSHAQFKEPLEIAVHRRLREEMGFDCELTEQFSFLYRVHIGELVEHEYDHVFFGVLPSGTTFLPNPDEVQAHAWVSLDWLQEDMKKYSNHYTAWFKIILGHR